MTTVLSILNKIATTSSRNDKENILNTHKENLELKMAFAIALDPILNFYIKKIPVFTTVAQPHYSLLDAYDSLGELSERRKTGNAAIEYLSRTLSIMMPDDAEVLARIIDRDLRCGVQASTVNKVWPGLVHEYPIMLSSKMSDVDVDKIEYPAGLQKKSDGMRINMVPAAEGEFKLYSRNGKLLDVHGVFDQSITEGKNEWVFDGELLVKRNGKILPRTEGNGICNKAVKGTISKEEADELVIVLWDAIPFKDWKVGKSVMTYKQRYMILSSYKGSMDPNKLSVMETENVNNFEEARQRFLEARRRREEGVMLKEWSGGWADKRVKHQVKLKGIYDADVRCVAWNEGDKKNAGRLGSLTVETSCGQLRCNVGTGFSDDQRNLKPEDVVGKILALQFNDIVKDRRTKAPKFFLPVLLEVREDKDTADTLEDLLKQIKDE